MYGQLIRNTFSLPQTAPAEQAAFIAPLDNFTWDRDLLRWMFDFDYIWEVYKPVKQRRFGYYVLPVILGDRFIARFDSSTNRVVPQADND